MFLTYTVCFFNNQCTSFIYQPRYPVVQYEGDRGFLPACRALAA